MEYEMRMQVFDGADKSCTFGRLYFYTIRSLSLRLHLHISLPGWYCWVKTKRGIQIQIGISMWRHRTTSFGHFEKPTACTRSDNMFPTASMNLRCAFDVLHTELRHWAVSRHERRRLMTAMKIIIGWDKGICMRPYTRAHRAYEMCGAFVRTTCMFSSLPFLNENGSWHWCRARDCDCGSSLSSISCGQRLRFDPYSKIHRLCIELCVRFTMSWSTCYI